MGHHLDGKDSLVPLIDRLNKYPIGLFDNDKPSFICNCCCCCELLGGIRQGFINGVAKAGFMANVDQKTCIGCGLCAKGCNIAALEITEADERKNAVFGSGKTCVSAAGPVSALARPARSP